MRLLYLSRSAQRLARPLIGCLRHAAACVDAPRCWSHHAQPCVHYPPLAVPRPEVQSQCQLSNPASVLHPSVLIEVLLCTHWRVLNISLSARLFEALKVCPSPHA
ncbi:hypothetical protein L1887_56233 [Cichorium endivia]|nr:hypothetical protein L1887_56233 [Cichorium endivia]